MEKTINIGTRGSPLAMWQANHVKGLLEGLDPELSCNLVVIKTKGDKILDVPLAKVGGKGLFVKEIETALLTGQVDVAVHSMKDMPAEIPEGLCIGAIPERESPFDALVMKSAKELAQLPRGAVLGTSSLRRAAQLLRLRPDFVIEPLRGNLDTRLKKLDTQDLDAVVLAMAGLKRMGFENRATQVLDPEIMCPAAGQGALCIEIRENDPVMGPLAAQMDDPDTRITVTAERAFLHRLEGGCQVPVAAHAVLENERLTLTGLVADLSGDPTYKDAISGDPAHAHDLGVELAQRLLDRGARQVLDSLMDH